MMTLDDKQEMLEDMLGITGKQADILETYLNASGREILSWRYGSGTKPDEVPEEYEMVQINAVVAGYSQRGAEGQTYHAENGINRTFAYRDMQDYIHKNVVPLAGVPM